jgi:hypothetical protein
VQLGSKVMLSARLNLTSAILSTKFFSYSKLKRSGNRDLFSSLMYTTFFISPNISCMDSTFSGEEDAQLIVRLTGEGDWRDLLILKALPLEEVLVKFSRLNLRALKRLIWLLGCVLK